MKQSPLTLTSAYSARAVLKNVPMMPWTLVQAAIPTALKVYALAAVRALKFALLWRLVLTKIKPWQAQECG